MPIFVPTERSRRWAPGCVASFVDALAGVRLKQVGVGMGEGVELAVRQLHDYEEGGLEALHVGGAAYGDARVVRPDGPGAADLNAAVREGIGDGRGGEGERFARSANTPTFTMRPRRMGHPHPAKGWRLTRTG